MTQEATGLSSTTYAELKEIAARYPQPRSGLLPMLHLVQASEGRITPEGIEACAEILGISAADVIVAIASIDPVMGGVDR